jgi:hypothetical protein
MAFTVVPLHQLDLPNGSTIPFGNKFVLQDVPQWLKNDSTFLADLCRTDRKAVLDAKHALVAELISMLRFGPL